MPDEPCTSRWVARTKQANASRSPRPAASAQPVISSSRVRSVTMITVEVGPAGNRGPVPRDPSPMRCDDCRDAISARLDGEDGPGESAAVDAHLATCGSCRAFADDAARVTRLARTRLADEGPDLVPQLLAAWDARQPDPVAVPTRRGRERATDLVRVALGGLAVGQMGLGMAGIVAATDPAHHDMTLSGASVAHFSHESAAWNLALGVAFLWVALRGTRTASALVPVLSAFVGVLVVLSVPDLLAGRVDPSRLVGHGLVVAGLVLLLAHRLLARGGGGGATGAADHDLATADESWVTAWPVPEAHRRWGDGPGLDPTARRVA